MQTLRRTVAILTFPAIAYLGAACERTDTPTEVRPMALVADPPPATPHPQGNDEAPATAPREILALVPDDLLIEPFGIELETLVTDALGFEVSTADAGGGTTFLVDDNLLDCPTAQFTSIQAAVNAASPGDRIKVCPGTYYEHVFINKRLRVVGDLQNPSTTVIDGGTSLGTDDHVAIHDASRVEFAGFKVINARSNDAYIGLQRASDNKIHHNLIELNQFACIGSGGECFEPVGIFLYDNSDGNDVYRNAVIGDNNDGFPGPSERGIMIFCETNPCDDNRIRSNSITNVTNGIQITDGQRNVIDHNEAFGNANGFRQFRFNFATGQSRVRHNRFHNNVVDPFGFGGEGINLSNTSGNTIHHNENNDNQRDGILLGSAVFGANGNLVNENVADSNDRDGIRVPSSSSGNTIKNNKMGSVPNTEHDAHDDSTGGGTAGTDNTWQNNFCNTSFPSGLCEHPL